MSGPIGELDTTDRVLLGACAAVWLAALGAGVAAVVALVDLGRSHPQGAESADTPWVLYTVIGLSGGGDRRGRAAAAARPGPSRQPPAARTPASSRRPAHRARFQAATVPRR